MPLYHSTRNALQAGDIIAPGNWGRVIFETGGGHPAWWRETSLESVRGVHYPGKPSRLKSTFYCDNLGTAELYRNISVKKGQQAAPDPLYEVEKVDPQAVEHRSDFNVVEPLPNHPDMGQIAHLYWTAGLRTTIDYAPNVICEEIVSLSALRVIRRL